MPFFLFYCLINISSKLHLLALLLPFLSGYLGDTETVIRPFAFKGHLSIAHLALPRSVLEVLGVVALLCECMVGIAGPHQLNGCQLNSSQNFNLLKQINKKQINNKQ